MTTIAEKTVNDQQPPDLFTARNVKRCAIYIRVSTAEQRIEGWSLDAQRAALTALAQAKGWKVVGVYADEGKSARKRLKDRKAIHRLMDDVRAGQVDVILFKELDRWFRSISDFYKIQDVLDQYGVEWFSQQQPTLEMRTKEGRLQVNVLLSVGQNETDAGSDRIKYTNKFLRQQKRWTSGASTLPRCYTLDDNQRVLIDPNEERYCRAIIDGIVQFGSVRYALLQAEPLTDSPFGYSNAMNMLMNPMLHGEYKEVPDFIEKPLLTLEEHNLLLSRIKKNARNNETNFYIFSGLLVCGGCGRNLTGAPTKKPNKLYKHYRCNQYALTKKCDNNVRINEEKLEEALLEYVQKAVADQILQVKAVKQSRKKKPRKKNNREAIERQLDKLEDVYISSDRMTKERYEQKKAAILAKLVEEEEPEEKLPELADLERVQALFDNGVADLYREFTPEERREFWRGILTRAVIRGRDIVSVDFIK